MNANQQKTFAAAIVAILTVAAAAYLLVPSPKSLDDLASMEAARHERERSKALQAAFKKTTSPAQAHKIWDTLPQTEQLFCGALVRRLADFSTTTSKSKRKKARKHRAEGVQKAVPGGKFVNWRLTVSGNENGTLQLRLPEPCDSFHLIGTGPATPIGTSVVVSGAFQSDPESSDGFAENSSTLDDTMQHAEYSVVISSVE